MHTTLTYSIDYRPIFAERRNVHALLGPTLHRGSLMELFLFCYLYDHILYQYHRSGLFLCGSLHHKETQIMVYPNLYSYCLTLKALKYVYISPNKEAKGLFHLNSF